MATRTAKLLVPCPRAFHSRIINRPTGMNSSCSRFISQVRTKLNVTGEIHTLRFCSAKKSKDPRTKIGAVLVRDRRDLISGFNGIPEGRTSLIADVLDATWSLVRSERSHRSIRTTAEIHVFRTRRTECHLHRCSSRHSNRRSHSLRASATLRRLCSVRLHSSLLFAVARHASLLFLAPLFRVESRRSTFTSSSIDWARRSIERSGLAMMILQCRCSTKPVWTWSCSIYRIWKSMPISMDSSIILVLSRMFSLWMNKFKSKSIRKRVALPSAVVNWDEKTWTHYWRLWHAPVD